MDPNDTPTTRYVAEVERIVGDRIPEPGIKRRLMDAVWLMADTVQRGYRQTATGKREEAVGRTWRLRDLPASWTAARVLEHAAEVREWLQDPYGAEKRGPENFYHVLFGHAARAMVERFTAEGSPEPVGPSGWWGGDAA